jgi:hypothetical protein
MPPRSRPWPWPIQQRIEQCHSNDARIDTLQITFSTFSAEIVILLQSGRTAWALGAVAAHLLGSLLMTFAGIATVIWLNA